MKLTAIDFETANGSPASVCAVGAVSMEDGVIGEPFYTLIRPADNVSYFDPFNIRIHGITPAMAAAAPSFEEVYASLLPYFENAVVAAHNARFDMTCLKEACRNLGLPVPPLRYFDTVSLSRKMYPQLPHHRLNGMCAYLGISLHHHHAASDAYGCLMIAVSVMQQTGIYEPEEMLKACRARICEL